MPVEILFVQAPLSDAQLLLRLRLEVLRDNVAGQQRVARDFLGHVQDAPEHERQQRQRRRATAMVTSRAVVLFTTKGLRGGEGGMW